MFTSRCRSGHFVLSAMAGFILCIFTLSGFRVLQGEETPVLLAEEKPAVELEAAFFSKYIWRGGREVNGGVLQTTAVMSWAGAYVEYWGNMDLTDSGGRSGDFTETNLAFGWGVSILDIGALYYAFPDSPASSTTELYAGVEIPVPLSPTLTLYQDVDGVRGRYLSIGAGHSFEDVISLTEGVSVSVDLGAALGYADSKHNEEYYGKKTTSFTDTVLTLELPIGMPNGLTLTPSLTYSTIAASRIRRVMEHKDHVVGGVSLGYSF